MAITLSSASFFKRIRNRRSATLTLTALVFLLWILALSHGAAEESGPPVPDVVVLVFSGVLPSDGISFTYKEEVDKDVAEADLDALLEATGWTAKETRITTTGEPKMTSVEFQVDGAVNWGSGILLVEPFALAFKRFDLVQVNYVLQGAFPFRSLTDYKDKHVDISWMSKNNSQIYTIRIKDRGFDRLGLPLAVAPEVAKQKQKVEEKDGHSGTKIWLALLLALVAGVIVFAMVSRIGRK
ncbi:MAG: hypothetical protein HYX78_07080 [Armatimonadetes bacterium]|nr:hypothetical protein [Armatimonadota bacterium]